MVENQNAVENIDQDQDQDQEKKESSFMDELASQGIDRLIIEAGEKIIDLSKDVISNIADNLDF